MFFACPSSSDVQDHDTDRCYEAGFTLFLQLFITQV